MSIADTLIIGAGPAGSGCALELSKLGRKVVVLDSKSEYGNKLCTGIVGTDCLNRFGPKDPTVYRDIVSATVVLPSGKTANFSMDKTYAYVIDRVGFVADIAHRAAEAGALFMQQRNVTSIEIQRNGVRVWTDFNGQEEIYEGRSLILASGFGSRLTRSLGIGPVGDFVLASQVEVETNGLDETEIFLGKKQAPGFFGWLVPRQEGRALLGLMSRKDAVGYLRSLSAKLTTDGKITGMCGKPAKWGIPLKPPSHSFGNRFLLVGDCAGQVKPTTGGGIYYALLCAEMAAETLDVALERDDLSSNSLKSYETKWKNALGKELTIGFFARRIYEALDDRLVEVLANTISNNGIHRDLTRGRSSSFDWHSDIILKGIKHRAISKVIDPLKSIIPSLRW